MSERDRKAFLYYNEIVLSQNLPDTSLLTEAVSGFVVLLGLGLSALVAGLVTYISDTSSNGIDDLVGRIGVSVTPLDPKGQIRLKGEIWQAACTGQAPLTVPVGRPVKVIAYLGLLLIVEPVARGEGE